MTSNRDIERVLDHWFAERPADVADRVLDDVADRISRQRQRPAWRVPLRGTHVTTYVKPLLGIAAIVVVAVAGLALLRPFGPAVGGPPETTASPAPSPVVTPSATPAPSSSVGVASACDLMTADEAGNALHIPSLVTAESLQHPRFDAVVPPSVRTAFCGFRSGATSLFVLRYETGNGADAFAIWKKAPGSEAVSGLGEDAAWAPAKSALYILKGDRLVTIMPLEDSDATLTLEATRAIGEIVAPRM